MTVVPVGRRARLRSTAVAAALALAAGSTIAAAGTAQGAAGAQRSSLVLVTFDGPGTSGYRGPLGIERYRALLSHRQEAALSRVGAPDPVYRWTTALSGVAVELTDPQVARLRVQPHVSAVEENQVRPLAASAAPARDRARRPVGRGGAGTVVGIVDTGIWPDSPLFSGSPAQAPRPARFAGSCETGEDWPAGTCDDKLVAGQWFVDGYGEERVAADEPLSPRDVRGHGTQVASIAAGNAGVPIGAPGLHGDYSGVAPRAAIAAYKACWSAPDPDDDGCATADVVAAIDRATRDRVDVLNLSVAGAPGIDAVERALLGAAEAGIVVVAAAGNTGADGYATHVSPWVTTVGALTGPTNAGTVVLGTGRRLPGVMTAHERVSARVVRAASIAAPGSTRREAALCTPGALDASRAADKVVVCERGGIARVAKSAAVDRARGAGMVLVNVRAGAPAHDLHAVPTVHLGREAGRSLTRWLRRHPRGEVTLEPTRATGSTGRVPAWSAGGDPTGSLVKPDLVAPGTGLLGAAPPSAYAGGWALLSGTSAAAAWTSGAAAALIARHDWSAAAVRSALVTTSEPVGASVLRAGAGRLRPAAARHARLVHDERPGDYRAWLSGNLGDVNAPSAVFHGPGATTRRVTNVGGRSDTWQASVTGFERYAVTVSPATLTVRPGRTASYRITVAGGSLAGGLDGGTITWRAADGSAVRVPVAVGR